MICKYCHLDTHLIDDCPTIICKKCKEVGHPQWLCTQKKKPKNSSKSDLKRSFSSTSSLTKHTIKEEDERSISYYLKTINTSWSSFCLDE